MKLYHILNIETTADGSVTLYRKDIDEHYHSIRGALAESRHVYVELGWNKISSVRQPVRVFEVGFGTGLNAALTARAAMTSKVNTTYFAVELFPLSLELNDAIASTQPMDHLSEFRAVNSAQWDNDVEINPYFTLNKIKGDLLAIDLPQGIDVVYFDAFAPEKQPEMWDESVFRKLFQSMSPSGVLTTYCAKGAIRRLLQKVGFLTERLPGPPGGKREVLRATKPL